MSIITPLAPTALALLLASGPGCASAPEAEAEPPGPVAGPMRPQEPDLALDAAEPLDILDEDAMHAWLAARVAAAQAGTPERVRLPLIRRGPFGCDCPPFGIGPNPANGPFYWLAIHDLTSVGIPQGAWTGWVDGRFTGATEVYHSTDAGGTDSVLPVFEVTRQRARGPDEDPVVRVAPGRRAP